MEIKFLTQPYDANGNAFFIGEKINNLLKSKKPLYNKIWFTASFAKRSGVLKLKSNLKKALKNGAEINFILGINNHLTTVEALREILELGCNTKIFRNIAGGSIGAKIFCFEADGETAEVLISSGNITEGGLYKNHEVVVQITYDLTNNDDENKFSEFKHSISNLINPNEFVANDLNEELISILIDNEEIVSENRKKVNVKVKDELNENKTNQSEETDLDIDVDLLSIELPTGQSIEISLGDPENLSQKLDKLNEKNLENFSKSESTEKDHTDINHEQAEDEFDIEVEFLENIDSESEDKVERLLRDEIREYDQNSEEELNTHNKDEDQSTYISHFEVIDIEQMLYKQSHANDVSGDVGERPHTSISDDSLKMLKTRQSRKIVKEEKEIVQEASAEITKKKFIISSSLNKANGSSIINTFFIQINKLKGRGISGEVRMPVTARDFAPEFWGWPNKYSLVQSEGKTIKKSKKWIIQCKVIDVENPETSRIDTVDLYQEEGKSNFNFHSKVLVSFVPEENDIIRIIRVPEGNDYFFQCELIRASSKEYIIWEQFCSQVIKGSERKYGFA